MVDAWVLGASQGIGLGFVEQFLSRSDVGRVFATYRSRQSAQPLLALQAQWGDRLVCLALDAQDPNQIVAVVAEVTQQVAEAGTRLGWIINCIGMLHQGTLQPEKSLRQIDAAQLLTYFQVNSLPSVILAQHLAPVLKAKAGSPDRTIFATLSAKVGSIGDNQLGGWYGYRASKAALNMFIKTIALEYRRTCPSTIVVALHPGTTATNLSEPFRRNVPPEKLFSIERTVRQLMTVLESLSLENSGEFFSWDGTRLPW
jgi:NAD(P)-dependent dehydrogenase (short-subunit alcohol dehydrogenase family)